MNRQWRATLLFSGKLLLLGLLFAWAWAVLARLDWHQSATLVASASIPWLCAAGLLLAARPVAWAARWRLAAGRRGITLPLGWASAAVAGAMAVDHLTPTARLLGGLLRARWQARTYSSKIGVAFGPILYEQLSHEVLMALATMTGLVLLAALRGYGWVSTGLAALGILFVALTIWWFRRRGTGWLKAVVTRVGSLETGRARWRKPLADGGRDTLRELTELLKDHRLGASSLAWGIVILLLTVSAQLMVFASLDIAAGILIVLTTVALGNTAGAVAGTPGGVGATEAAMIGCYVLLGVAPADAAAGVALLRAGHYLMIFVMGLPALAAFELRARTQDLP